MLETSTIKAGLESWREVVLHLNAVLTWEKDWYAALVAGLVTFKFLLIWWWDPTLLSLMAVTGIFFTLVDFVGPKIMAQVCKPEAWTGAKEKKFEEICQEIVSFSAVIQDASNFCRDAKEKKPIFHFLGAVFGFVSLAWIGNRINNFFLLYLVVLLAAMLPGLHRKGLLQKYVSLVTSKVSEAVRGKEHLKKAE